MAGALEKMKLPEELSEVLRSIDKVIFPESREQLFELAMGGPGKSFNEISFSIPGMGKVVECTVARCKNGLAVNYMDPYMRRRDSDCMSIADSYPTDKPRFSVRYGRDFSGVRAETLEWFRSQKEAVVMPFMSGGVKWGYPSLLIVPGNSAFFAAILADIQNFIPPAELKEGFEPQAIMYVAPTFRLTHFGNKQVVVHNRTESLHEVFSYNLYPGPSAKKGVYGILLALGEKDGWTTLHGATVRVTTPYENEYTIIHESESGGGKSEMLEQIQREPNGRILLGENLISREKVFVDLTENARLVPVTDDMALAPSQLQDGERLAVTDAENGWFVRVNHISKYGSSPELEEMTIKPREPLIFLNIDASPNSTALIWEHTMDTCDKPCPNPRVVIPRSHFNTIRDDVARVDLRSFGLRTPPSWKEMPDYGIVGLFHVLPPSIAWLWRLVVPRGASNPSTTSTAEGMSSEGIGSYWPFATGRRVTHANILLRQIAASPQTRNVIIPVKHIGCYDVSFKAEWISREYLSRRGQAKFSRGELEAHGTPLLGYSMRSVKVDGKEIPKQLLRVFEQPEVGMEAFLQGSRKLEDFFKQELRCYLCDDLDPLGREIIESFMRGDSLQELEKLMPCPYICEDGPSCTR
jgi:hypothetical protein